MKRHNIDTREKSNGRKRQADNFNDIYDSISDDIALYNKLSDSDKAKWLENDKLLKKFIRLAKRVKF